MPDPVRHARRSLRRCAATHQRGAVLIVGLVILLVVTMIGISGQQSTVLQERLAGNMRQNNLALQAAEAGLQAGLSYIEQQDVPIRATEDGANHVWTSCSVADAEGLSDEAGADRACNRLETVLGSWRKVPSQLEAGEAYEGVAYADLAGVLDNAQGGNTSVAIPGVVAQPRIYIEVRQEPVSPDTQANSFGRLVTYYYTVTSVGFGGNEQSRAVLQSTIVQQVHQ